MGRRWAPAWNSVPVTLDLLSLFFPRQLGAPFEFLLISTGMFCFDLHYLQCSFPFISMWYWDHSPISCLYFPWLWAHRTSIPFIMYTLATHQDVQKKRQDETDRALPSKVSGWYPEKACIAKELARTWLISLNGNFYSRPCNSSSTQQESKRNRRDIGDECNP